MTKQSLTGYVPDNCVNLDHFPHIKGYDFNEKFDFNKFLKSYSNTGFQATNIGKAVEIIKAMRREKAQVFLAYTSNMVSSGVREVIRYLAEHKFVDVLVTTAGGIEEDVIKSLKPFVLGSFEADGRSLFEKGINRTGNIFVTNDRYTYFEKHMNGVLDGVYKTQVKRKKPLCSSEIIEIVGKSINDKGSILYWAWKNKIPVFCPALTDGAFGDMIFFMKQRKKDFYVDISEDMVRIVNLVLNAKKTGVIILGGGVAKHYTLNAQIFREGCDFAVYVNTADEFDGSDSGAKTNEAVTWGKIKANAPQVKVHGDATMIFPLIVAGLVNDLNNKK
ncbi:deoxyhypusine synthase [Candidatus Woesearchaeota archaeon]|nr:deoxyhypusine synthase [Candidatus Woesearchaeota archaeon]